MILANDGKSPSGADSSHNPAFETVVKDWPHWTLRKWAVAAKCKFLAELQGGHFIAMFGNTENSDSADSCYCSKYEDLILALDITFDEEAECGHN